MRDIADTIRLAWRESPRRVILATLAIPVVLVYLYVLLVVAIVAGQP